MMPQRAHRIRDPPSITRPSSNEGKRLSAADHRLLAYLDGASREFHQAAAKVKAGSRTGRRTTCRPDARTGGTGRTSPFAATVALNASPVFAAALTKPPAAKPFSSPVAVAVVEGRCWAK